MQTENWTMSAKELKRLEIISQVEGKCLTQTAAAAELGISVRHFRRVLLRYRRAGAQGLVSQRRGTPPNNRIPDTVRQRAVALVREYYADFGPTFAHEKLRAHHADELGHPFSVETLRQWMIQAGIWKVKARRLPPVHQLRERRARFGELIQVDGSPHDWLEGRGERCTLIAFIDDATSAVTYLHFAKAETTFEYLDGLAVHLRRYERPSCLYSDRHSVFKVNAAEQQHPHELTQFSRALKDLDIEPIYARSPQAKGRVERLFKTLQDRLVKELRLAGIRDREEANCFLEAYRERFNQRFARAARSPEDVHRAVAHDAAHLQRILSKQCKRRLSKALICQYKNTQYLVQSKGPGYALRGATVTVCERADGKISVLYKGRELPFIQHRQGQVLPAVEDAKGLDRRVDEALKRQRAHRVRSPAATHPWKRWNPGYLSSSSSDK